MVKNLIFSKKGQEEMVGFALIVIVVAIILLFFLGFALTNDSGTGLESHETESFVQSFLQYTTTCKQNFDYSDVQDLIYSCADKETCNNGEETCDVLNSTLENILEASWNVGNDSFYKAYELSIVSGDDDTLINLGEGDKTNTYKGSSYPLPQNIDVIFRVYS